MAWPCKWHSKLLPHLKQEQSLADPVTNLARERPNGITGLGMKDNRPHDCECIKTGTCRVAGPGELLRGPCVSGGSWLGVRGGGTRASAPPAALNDLVQATTMFRRPPYRVYMRLSGVGANEAAFGAPKSACGKTCGGRSGSDRERETKTASSCRENPDSKTDGYLLPRI